MISEFIELFEGVALRTNPERAIRLLGLLPPSFIDAMQRARFRRTLRLAAERSPFYREQFRRAESTSVVSSTPRSSETFTPPAKT